MRCETEVGTHLEEMRGLIHDPKFWEYELEHRARVVAYIHALEWVLEESHSGLI